MLVETQGQAVQARDAVARTLGGEACVVRRFVNPDPWRREILKRVARLIGDEQASELDDSGLEQLHRWLNPSQLVALTEALALFFRNEATDSLPYLMQPLLGQAPFYFERCPNVRIHIPYDFWLKGRSHFNGHAKVAGPGKLNSHAPHRDSDHGCPTNAFNVWVALGRVRRGNGICLYPKAWRQPRLTRESFQEPVSFELEPGDAVLFSGEQLHTSEANYTDESRVVVSFRLTLNRPKYRSASLHDYVCSRPGLLKTLEWWFFRVLNLLRLRFGGPVKAPHLQVDARSSPCPGSVEVTAEGVTLDPEALPGAGIWPVNDKLCLFRMESGKVGLMRRRCPHQGADLALVGRVAGERIVCPWHNTQLDPTAQSPDCPLLRLAVPHARERRGKLLRLNWEPDPS